MLDRWRRRLRDLGHRDEGEVHFLDLRIGPRRSQVPQPGGGVVPAKMRWVGLPAGKASWLVDGAAAGRAPLRAKPWLGRFCHDATALKKCYVPGAPEQLPSRAASARPLRCPVQEQVGFARD
jgi:hypothetical protein